MSERWTRIRELFVAAQGRPATERDAWLAEACAGDAELLAEVRSLLEASREDDVTFEPPSGDALRALLGHDVRPLEPGARLGSFRVVRRVAAGGMGVVYEAEQDEPRRRVALKVLRQGLDSPSALRRFRHEAQILAGLKHPGIATIHGSGVDRVAGRDVPWYAMEFVEGARDLVTHADAEGLDLEARLRLFADVCDAVHHGHERGVVHRDLKPDNVLVDSSGRPRVIDFGVAKAVGADVGASTLETRSGAVLGTLATMSPEQVAGATLDARSDVYALGAMLYRLLCGRWPHALEQLALPEVARVIREDAPPRPATLDPRLRGDPETIVLRALEKEPARRYPTAAALADDLRRFLAREPIRARPPSLTYQARVFTRRHRVLVGALAVVALVSLAAAGVSLAAARRAEAAERDATRRYALVREVGRELLYDVLDELATVSGNTRARAHVARTAVAFLEALEAEAAEDPELLRDVAAGYLRLGRFQGARGGTSLGRAKEARASYVRGLELARGVEELAPVALDLRLALARVEERLGRWEAAGRMQEEALADARALGLPQQTAAALADLGDRAREDGEFAPARARYDEALEVLTALGPAAEPLERARVHGLAAGVALDARDMTRAEDHLDARAAHLAEVATRAPETADLRAQEVELHGQRAVLEDHRGDAARSLAHAERGVEAARALVAADPHDGGMLAQLGWLLELRGVAELELGKLEAGRASFAEGAERMEAGLLLEPDDLRLATRACEMRLKQALTHLRAGEPDVALPLARAALERLEAVFAEDPAAVTRERALSLALNVLGDCLLHTGAVEEATAVFARFLEVAGTRAARAPNEVFAQHQLMVAQDRVGMVHQRLGEDSARPPAERIEHLERAVEAYSTCLETVDELRARGFLEPTDADAARALEADLERCDEARARLVAERSKDPDRSQ